MKNNNNNFSIRARLSSFKYAFRGLYHVIKNEPNFLIHIVISIPVIVLGFFLHISLPDWIAIILCIGLVMVTEILNSAIERLTDMVSPQVSEKAKIVKDITASAVLLAAVTAIITGCMVFIPHIF